MKRYSWLHFKLYADFVVYHYEKTGFVALISDTVVGRKSGAVDIMQNIAYCAFGTDKLTEEAIKKMSGYLPYSRIEKSQKYLNVSDRNNCIAAYFMLLYGLLKNYGISHIPEVRYNKYGKPFFTNDNEIYFNISHCSGAVCCALSSRDIGVDIQEEISDYKSILSIAMSEGEKEAILLSDSPADLSTRFWSQKEAYLKFRSTGLTDGINEYDFSGYTGRNFEFNEGNMTTESYEGYSISVCCEKGDTRIITAGISEYIAEFKKIQAMLI